MCEATGYRLQTTGFNTTSQHDPVVRNLQSVAPSIIALTKPDEARVALASPMS